VALARVMQCSPGDAIISRTSSCGAFGRRQAVDSEGLSSACRDADALFSIWRRSSCIPVKNDSGPPESRMGVLLESEKIQICGLDP